MHLRVVRRADSRLVRQLDTIESAFSAHHEQLLTSLDALESELTQVSESGRGAQEQIAFLRVGLRCLADALGELHANLADLATGDSTDEQPRPGAGGAA